MYVIYVLHDQTKLRFRIISLNVRGLGDRQKRRAVFDYYRTRAEILCLQETHCTSECEQIWNSEWGGRGIYSHGNSTSKGVCILFKKNFFCNIVNISRDLEGRVICCEINLSSEDPNITICNIYAPNQDSPAFVDAIGQRLVDYSEQRLIIGDFNLVLDNSLDKNPPDTVHGNRRAIAKLKDLMQELYITDIWRSRNPGVKRFSWARNNQMSRLDFALVSIGLDRLIDNCTYLQGVFTDHSAFYLSISPNSNKRGPGFWRLNSSILEDSTIKVAIANQIQIIFSRSVGTDPLQRWSNFKAQIAKFLQETCRKAAEEDKQTVANLSEIIDEYEASRPLKESDTVLYNRTKADLEDLLLKRASKLIFRSGARWMEDGEKCTRYFLNLERAKYNAKTCARLFRDDNTILTEDVEIS